MKLPSKIEVNTQVAAQRKAQIDEGVRIAEKVDALRQKLGSLESQHEKFILGMEDELNRRTGGLVIQVAHLQKDVLDLEEQKRRLQVPLDAEWESLKKQKAELDSTLTAIVQRESRIIERECVQDTRDRKSKELKVLANTRDRESKKAYEDGISFKKDAQKINKDAVLFKEKTEKDMADGHYLLDQREKAIDAQERVFAAKELDFAERDKEIAAEKLRLADQRATIEREMKRIKP